MTDWRPHLSDVAALLRTRTVDARGFELGTFTARTRPRADQVEKAITAAEAVLAGRIGHALPEALVDDARAVAALRAAFYVEVVYFPRPAGDVRLADQLEALANDAELGLRRSLDAFGLVPA